jgi:transcriptional regulator with XRE-family HTH domain
MVEAFGSRLRGLRQARGVSVRGLAGLVGIDSALLSRIERGKGLPPSWLVERVWEALDLSQGDSDALTDLENALRMTARLDGELGEYIKGLGEGIPALIWAMRVAGLDAEGVKSVVSHVHTLAPVVKTVHTKERP